MPGAYCYAELGCMIQKSGADYAYIHFAFGPFLAFIRMWIECIILRPCIGAIQSLTFALYILKPFFPECEPPSDSVRILAAACLCLLCFINCFSVKWAAMVRQCVLTTLTTLVFSGPGLLHLRQVVRPHPHLHHGHRPAGPRQDGVLHIRELRD